MSFYLPSFALLCVARLVCALPSADFGIPVDIPFLHTIEETRIGSPCVIYDARRIGGVVRGANEQTLLPGTCQQEKKCPLGRLHFGGVSFCTRDLVDGVCCLDKPVACLNVGQISGSCRNSDMSSFCPNGEFLDPNSYPDACPLGNGADQIQCCVPDLTSDTASLPMNKAVSDAFPNPLVPGSTNLYRPQDISAQINDGRTFFPIPFPRGVSPNLFEYDSNKSPTSSDQGLSIELLQ